MAKYGFPYQGPKNKLAESIVKILPCGRGKRLVDLFGGGGALSHCAVVSGRWDTVLYNEFNPLVYDLFKRGAAGEIDFARPRWVSREEFKEKSDKDGLIKYIWSFGNKGTTYLFGQNNEKTKQQGHYLVVDGADSAVDFFCNKYQFAPREWFEFIAQGKDWHERRVRYGRIILKTEALKVIKLNNATILPFVKLSGQELFNYPNSEIVAYINKYCPNCPRKEYKTSKKEIKQLARLEFSNCDYRAVPLRPGDVIYCDPPYAGTQKYNKQNFDHDTFWAWVRACPYPVYVSEFSAPDDIECIAQWSKRGLMAGANQKTHKTECLFWNGK